MPTKSADVFLDFKSSVRMDLWLLGLSFRSELVNGNELSLHSDLNFDVSR